MKNTYNRIAGQNVERLAALSDGIFGVAMTLLLLDLQVPKEIKTNPDLWRALVHLMPDLLVYLMSFITLGIFWIGQQTQLNHLKNSDRDLTWIHLGFLFGVTILPFSTRLLADYISFRPALLTYWLNILYLGVLLYFCWMRATRVGLVKDDLPDDVRAAICRRIILSQALYAVGALLCFVSTYLSIGFIVLEQLNFAFAPRWRRRNSVTR